MIKDNTTFPIAAEIDLTNICNHNCVWCMFEGFRKRTPESTYDGISVKAEG